MTEDVSTVDDAQLARWAYGRATTPADVERAGLAAAELQRRATTERAQARLVEAERDADAAHALAVANDEVDESAREHPEPPQTDSERRHRRRMLATGIAGVTAAALALGAGVVVLSQPNPDPLGVFDRAESDLDREWAVWTSENLAPAMSKGPRVIALDGTHVGLAFRVPAVSDGRSTAWDPVCLYVADSLVPADLSSVSGNCVLPTRLIEEGLLSPIRPDGSEGEFDTVVWGPVGPPRLERNVPLDLNELFGGGSVVDRMVFGVQQFGNEGSELVDDVLELVDEPDRLLLGPAVVIQSQAGAGFGVVTTYAVVLSSDDGAVDAGEIFCLLIVASDGTTETACDSLSTVRDFGFEVPLTAAGRSWIMRIDPDGPNRVDSAQLLD